MEEFDKAFRAAFEDEEARKKARLEGKEEALTFNRMRESFEGRFGPLSPMEIARQSLDTYDETVPNPTITEIHQLLQAGVSADEAKVLEFGNSSFEVISARIDELHQHIAAHTLLEMVKDDGAGPSATPYELQVELLNALCASLIFSALFASYAAEKVKDARDGLMDLAGADGTEEDMESEAGRLMVKLKLPKPRDSLMLTLKVNPAFLSKIVTGNNAPPAPGERSISLEAWKNAVLEEELEELAMTMTPEERKRCLTADQLKKWHFD